jgi:hypothetical protein
MAKLNPQTSKFLDKEKTIDQTVLKLLFNYDPETGILSRKVRTTNSIQVGNIAGTTPKHNLPNKVSVNNRLYKTHRVIWLWFYGELPEMLDHIDHDKNNNRISNLRPASKVANSLNRKVNSHNTSGFKGVGWSNQMNKWFAKLKIAGRQKVIGFYTDRYDAACAYNYGAQLYYGEFAYYNGVDHNAWEVFNG